MKLNCIPPDLVETVWPHLCDGLQLCLDKGIGANTVDEMRDRCIEGKWLLFTVEDSGDIVVSAICSLDVGTKRIFTIGQAWGSRLDEWIDEFYDGMIVIARQLDCDLVAITGRRGWSRKLRSRGFRERMTTVTLTL